MKTKIITEIEQSMLKHLDNAQLEKLHRVLEHVFSGVTISKSSEDAEKASNEDVLNDFIAAKKIEGCSDKSLKYYRKTITVALNSVGKEIKHITTDDLRSYLTKYQEEKKSSKVTMDNIRRILSSFFSWLEDEDYIIKSPVRRIHKVKTSKTIKETYTDENLELMRDSCVELRDLAMIDMLASTGMVITSLTGMQQPRQWRNIRMQMVYLQLTSRRSAICILPSRQGKDVMVSIQTLEGDISNKETDTHTLQQL